jgi:hypothetical protein
MTAVAVVMVSGAAVVSTVKLMRSMSRPGLGEGGVGGGGDECLIGRQQRPDLLLEAMNAAGAQDTSVEDGGFDRGVGRLGLPPFVIEMHQLAGRVAGVVEQVRMSRHGSVRTVPSASVMVTVASTIRTGSNVGRTR